MLLWKIFKLIEFFYVLKKNIRHMIQKFVSLNNVCIFTVGEIFNATTKKRKK